MNHDTNDNFSGIFVPRFILEDKRLGHLERLLFGLIDGLAKSERGFFASNGFCSRLLGITPRRVQMSLKTLEQAGIIRRSLKVVSTKPFKVERVVFTLSSSTLDRITRPGREENFVPSVKKTSPPPRRKLRIDSKEDRKEDKLSTPPFSRRKKIRVDTREGF